MFREDSGLTQRLPAASVLAGVELFDLLQQLLSEHQETKHQVCKQRKGSPRSRAEALNAGLPTPERAKPHRPPLPSLPAPANRDRIWIQAPFSHTDLSYACSALLRGRAQLQLGCTQPGGQTPEPQRGGCAQKETKREEGRRRKSFRAPELVSQCLKVRFHLRCRQPCLQVTLPATTQFL